MTKEMKKKGEAQFQFERNRLDSLYKVIAIIPNENSESLKKQFAFEKNALEEVSQEFAAQESEKIWKRLNDYIEQYSIQNNYKIVLGITNQQQVLFVNQNTDITEELISFINKRYEGEN